MDFATCECCFVSVWFVGLFVGRGGCGLSVGIRVVGLVGVRVVVAGCGCGCGVCVGCGICGCSCGVFVFDCRVGSVFLGGWGGCRGCGLVGGVVAVSYTTSKLPSSNEMLIVVGAREVTKTK